MNEILPKIKKETIFDRIKKWFKINFEKKQVEENLNEISNTIITSEKQKNDFIEKIQINNDDKIILLQKRLKEGMIEISDLTENELEELIDLYEKQIQEKKDKLRVYREKMKKNKKENKNGIL